MRFVAFVARTDFSAGEKRAGRGCARSGGLARRISPQKSRSSNVPTTQPREEYYFPPRFALITSQIHAATSGPPSRARNEHAESDHDANFGFAPLTDSCTTVMSCFAAGTLIAERARTQPFLFAGAGVGFGPVERAV
jgi:hypothetical protein